MPPSKPLLIVNLKGSLGTEAPAEVYLSDEGIILISEQLGELGLKWDDLAQIVGHPRVEDKISESLAMNGAWV